MGMGVVVSPWQLLAAAPPCGHFSLPSPTGCSPWAARCEDPLHRLQSFRKNCSCVVLCGLQFLAGRPVPVWVPRWRLQLPPRHTSICSGLGASTAAVWRSSPWAAGDKQHGFSMGSLQLLLSPGCLQSCCSRFSPHCWAAFCPLSGFPQGATSCLQCSALRCGSTGTSSV